MEEECTDLVRFVCIVVGMFQKRHQSCADERVLGILAWERRDAQCGEVVHGLCRGRVYCKDDPDKDVWQRAQCMFLWQLMLLCNVAYLLDELFRRPVGAKSGHNPRFQGRFHRGGTRSDTRCVLPRVTTVMQSYVV